MKNNLLKKCKMLKVILTDVDGVLTDGGMYYTKNGDTMKKFHTRDGMGITLLRKKNIPTIIVTKEKNRIIRQWGRKMRVEKIYDGIVKKDAILDEICSIFAVKASEVCYIGDDVNDVELMRRVGFSACPNDGNQLTKKNSDYICKANGGQGALREISDLILYAKFPNQKNFY